MPRINTLDRVIIENIKQNNDMRIFLEKDKCELAVRGDSQFAHDIALAYQSLVLRKKKSANNNNGM